MATPETVSLQDGNGKTIFSGTGDEFSSAVQAISLPKNLYRNLRLDGRAGDTFPVPGEEDFDDGEFLNAEDAVAEFVSKLIEHFHDEFFHLEDAKIRFFWKAKGGSSGGNNTLGKCQKPSGLLKHYADADYVIWFAADHLRSFHFTRWQMLALVYHELRHTGLGEKGEYIVLGHHFEGFVDEIERFGPWKINAKAVITAAQKLPLFD